MALSKKFNILHISGEGVKALSHDEFFVKRQDFIHSANKEICNQAAVIFDPYRNKQSELHKRMYESSKVRANRLDKEFKSLIDKSIK